MSHRPSLFKYHQFLLRLDGNNGWSFEELNQEKEVRTPSSFSRVPRASRAHTSPRWAAIPVHAGPAQLMSITGEIASLTAKLAEVPQVQARLAEVNRQLKL